MGAWWVLRLMAEGHKVDYYLSEDKYEDVLGGLIPPPKMLSLDHRKHQGGYGFPSYEKYDLSLFDLTGRAKQADHSSSVCPTLGDGSFEHLLEDDREFGIKCMEECGINVPPYTRFDNPSQAKSFLKKENKRFVFKPFTIGGTTQDTATTYVSKGPDDMIEFIDRLWIAAKQAPFILQEFVAGTEIGTEAFFNGSDFYLLTGTLEEKKFMNDNKGPNTGCAGNTIFAMNQDAKIYKEGLLKARPMLQAAGFRGIIDLNTIVTEDKMYGLEWTPRFGYLCCPSIASMYGKGYGELLYDIASGKSPTIRWSAKYAAAATITIPPYPTEMRIAKTKRTPIGGIDPEDIEELQNTYLFDAMMEKDKLVTSGNYGYIGALITTGNSIDEAFGALDRRLKKIDIPNCQYRTDLKKVGEDKYNFLLDKGWI
jgi:phosphoribosylamine--glycine ligase